MQAADIMTTQVVTVTPDTTVQEIAQILLKNRISAVPVVDAAGALQGIVSEGDLVRRVETETEAPRSWWLDLFALSGDRQEQFIKSHGRKAKDVMTREVVTVAPDASLAAVAGLLESRGIKRAPVVQAGKLVGIISRANLLHGLAAAEPPIPPRTADDRALREAVLHAIAEKAGLSSGYINVVVQDGVAQLWGTVHDDTEERAIIVAAENVPGVKGVENRLGRMQTWAFGY